MIGADEWKFLKGKFSRLNNKYLCTTAHLFDIFLFNYYCNLKNRVKLTGKKGYFLIRAVCRTLCALKLAASRIAARNIGRDADHNIYFNEFSCTSRSWRQQAAAALPALFAISRRDVNDDDESWKRDYWPFFLTSPKLYIGHRHVAKFASPCRQSRWLLSRDLQRKWLIIDSNLNDTDRLTTLDSDLFVSSSSLLVFGEKCFKTHARWNPSRHAANVCTTIVLWGRRDKAYREHSWSTITWK